MKRKLCIFATSYFWIMKNIILLAVTLLFGVRVCVAQNEQMQQKDTTIYTFTEVAPEYPGGQTAMFSFLAQTVEYPEEARLQGITGTVLVKFVIEKDGSVSNVKVIVPLHPALDEAAVRGIQKMPKWKPATMAGNPVRAAYNIPIRFYMSKTDVKEARKAVENAQKK